MRKIVLVVAVLIFLMLPILSFAQSDKEIQQARAWLGQWKRNYASPTYGVALFHGKLLDGPYTDVGGVPEDQRDFPATAMDFRIFRGVNVSRRGGFYTGVETGVLFLAPFIDTTFDEPNLDEQMHLRYNGGLVFLMAKYGLRMDIGIALFGISLGAELGMGGTLFAGGFDFWVGDDPNNPIAEEGFGTSRATMGLILDTAGEASIRIGKNFRLVGKVGFIAAPISVPKNEDRDQYIVYTDETGTHAFYQWEYNSGGTGPSEIQPGSDEYYRAIMSQYGVEIDPFALDFRVGFVLNFQ